MRTSGRSTPRVLRAIGRSFGLIVLSLTLCAGCQTPLQGGLSEEDANEALLALHNSGIAADKSEDTGAGSGRFRLMVAHGDLLRGLTALREAELPRDRAAESESVLAPTLIPSLASERARSRMALSLDLARTLETLEGVLRARVHVDDSGGHIGRLDDAPTPRHASVLIRHRPSARRDSAAVRAIVAGAVAGLEQSNVAVVWDQAPALATERPQWVSLGPIRVDAQSADALKSLLAGSFGLNILLVLGLVVFVRRRNAL